ncbi:WD40/YVTN/BNR-like repeat-containing protein [Ornithinimicrobium sp. W1679]|uniref:WD40/YVTN/BNR-like repeat-containing protein n=1 Tax=unclassified Ornithinimicrobium TaxID=2615080 RepID=UPI003CEDFBDB
MTERDDRQVEDFFAAHRRRVLDHPADEESWEQITVRAARSRPGSRGAWFLAGAVAASAVAMAVLVGQGTGGGDVQPALPAGPGDDGAVVSTGPPGDVARGTDTADATDGGEGEGGADGGAGQDGEVGDGPTADDPGDGTDAGAGEDGGTGEAGPVTLPPADLSGGIWRVEEPSSDEGGVTSAVYQTCAADAEGSSCPGLAVSEEEGRSWTARADLAAAGFEDAVSGAGSVWVWSPAGPGTDAAGETSAALLRSDDAGLTWTPVPTRGEGVMRVEVFRSTLVVVTQGCEEDTESCLEVVVTDVEDDDATEGRRHIVLDDLPATWWGAPGPLPQLSLQATYDAVYLVLTHEGVAYRIEDGEEVATRVERPGCGLATAPESQDGLVSWCLGSGTVGRSPDGGDTWEEIPAPSDGEVLAVASNDGRRLVVATGTSVWTSAGEDGWDRTLGLPTRVDTLLRADGGTSLRVGTVPVFVQTPDGEDGAGRWTSEDDGLTWTEQPPFPLPDGLP